MIIEEQLLAIHEFMIRVVMVAVEHYKERGLVSNYWKPLHFQSFIEDIG